MLYSGKGRHSLKNIRPCIFFSIEFFAYAKNSTYPFPVRASCPLSLPKNKSFIRSDTRSGTLDVTDVSADVSLTKLALEPVRFVQVPYNAGNGFRMRLLHGAQKAMKELYRDVQFF